MNCGDLGRTSDKGNEQKSSRKRRALTPHLAKKLAKIEESDGSSSSSQSESPVQNREASGVSRESSSESFGQNCSKFSAESEGVTSGNYHLRKRRVESFFKKNEKKKGKWLSSRKNRSAPERRVLLTAFFRSTVGNDRLVQNDKVPEAEKFSVQENEWLIWLMKGRMLPIHLSICRKLHNQFGKSIREKVSLMMTKEASNGDVVSRRIPYAQQCIDQGNNSEYDIDLKTESDEEGEECANGRHLNPEQNGEYVVEEILAEKLVPFGDKIIKMRRYFYVKWKGWPHYYDSWEPCNYCTNSAHIVTEYRKRREALSVWIANSDRYSLDSKLSQLRNLFRWERQIRTVLKEANILKPIYVYNDLDDTKRPDFTYILKNILPEELAEKLRKAPTKNHYCQCAPGECGSNKNGCCFQKENIEMYYNGHGTLLPAYDEVLGNIVECSDRCSCGPKCSSKVVQRGRRHAVAIVRTPKCGWGVIALEDIPLNRFVCEYVGEVLPIQEASRRESHLYQFELDGDAKNTQYVIDARFYGNESAFINHSCDPNLIARKISIDRGVRNYYRIAFFTQEPIKRGDELTLDYFNNAACASHYITDEDGIRCMCGKPDCRKVFPQVMHDDTLSREEENAVDESNCAL